MNDTLVPYLAGLVDGEGCFSIQILHRFGHNTGHPSLGFSTKLCVALKYGPEVLDLFLQRWGGTIYMPKPEDQHGMTTWTLSNRQELAVAIKELLPHLRIKKKIAQRFLSSFTLSLPLQGIKRKNGERIYTAASAREMVLVATSLNPGYRRKHSPSYYLDLVESIYAGVN